MTRTVVMNEEIAGHKYNYILNGADVASGNYAICYPGVGECHATDLTKIENFNWYTKYIKDGTLNTPFNVITIQPHTTAALTSINDLIAVLIARYTIEKYFVVGISLGAVPCYSLLYKDYSNKMAGIAVFSGATITTSQSSGLPLNGAKDLRNHIVHGLADTTLPIANVTAFIAALNKDVTRANPFVLNTIQTSSGTWNGQLTADKTLPVYTKIIDAFASALIPSLCNNCKTSGRLEAINQVRAFLDTID